MPQTKTQDNTTNAFHIGLYVMPTPTPAEVALKVIAISAAPIPVITAYGAYKLWKWIS